MKGRIPPHRKCKCGSRRIVIVPNTDANEILVGRSQPSLLCRCPACSRWMRFYPSTGHVCYALSPNEKASIERWLQERVVLRKAS